MGARRGLVTAVAAALLLSSCGAPDVPGIYHCGEDVLDVRPDGTFTVVGHDRALEGTYEVEGETISFAVRGFAPATAVILDDGSLLFDDHQGARGRGPDAHRHDRCARRSR